MHTCEIESKEQFQSKTQNSVLSKFNKIVNKNKSKINEIKENRRRSSLFGLMTQLKVNTKMKQIVKRARNSISVKKNAKEDTIDQVVVKKGKMEKHIYKFYL